MCLHCSVLRKSTRFVYGMGHSWTPISIHPSHNDGESKRKPVTLDVHEYYFAKVEMWILVLTQ